METDELSEDALSRLIANAIMVAAHVADLDRIRNIVRGIGDNDEFWIVARRALPAAEKLALGLCGQRLWEREAVKHIPKS